MSKTFLYFLPNHPTPTASRADFEAFGLGHALEIGGGNPDSAPVGEGPGDTAGIVAAIGLAAGVMPSYSPAAQTWRKGPGGKYWVGYATADKPGPADLKRSRVYDGAGVQLLDGNEWSVPICHVPAFLKDRSGSLPRMIGLADDGETAIVRPHPRYMDLCERAQRMWMQYAGTVTDADKMKAEDQLRLAVDALAVNYRVGFVEAVGALGLFGEDELGAVIRTVIDAAATEEWARAQEAAAAAPKD